MNDENELTMNDPKKKTGPTFIVFGIVLMLTSVPQFIRASRRSAEAKEVAKVNEERAKIIEDSANMKRIIGFGSIAVGAVSLVIGIAKNKKEKDAS